MSEPLNVSKMTKDFGIFGFHFFSNDSVMIALMASSKLLYLLLSLIGARIFSPHKRHREEPKMMILFCALPLLSSILAFVLIQTASRMELNA